ncbi:MAG: hypothetical protein AAF078_00810 [Planctomycetota bacterium]
MPQFRATATAALLLAATFFATGCSYYAINEPSSDRTYYTTDFKQLKSGALVFTDDATGKEITIQNAEVEKIDEKQFKAATAGE